MHFDLIDNVIELSDNRIVAIKNVSLSEEYLQDHFPSFPVLPGVLMLETMVQAARRLLIHRDPALSRHVLGSVRALKYGSFVRPGETLEVEVSLGKEMRSGVYEFRGSGRSLSNGGGKPSPAKNTVGGRFTLRPPSPLR